MTSEKNLTEEFFRVFGIEPKKLFSARQGINPDAVMYPKITAEKLLEMICIINKSKFVRAVYLDDCNYTDLENTIIKKTITIMKNEFLNKKLKDEFKQQIQQLFKN